MRTFTRRVLRNNSGLSKVREVYGPLTRHGRNRVVPVPGETKEGQEYRQREELRRLTREDRRKAQ